MLFMFFFFAYFQKIIYVNGLTKTSLLSFCINMFDEINSIYSPVQKNNWEMAVEVPLIEQFNFNYNVIDPIVDIIFFI